MKQTGHIATGPSKARGESGANRVRLEVQRDDWRYLRGLAHNPDCLAPHHNQHSDVEREQFCHKSRQPQRVAFGKPQQHRLTLDISQPLPSGPQQRHVPKNVRTTTCWVQGQVADLARRAWRLRMRKEWRTDQTEHTAD